MTDKAADGRFKQVQSLRKQYQKTVRVWEFLVSEREIVLGLLEKSLRGEDKERVDNLRTRIHEKDRQLQLVKEELREIRSQLDEAERRLGEISAADERESR